MNKYYRIQNYARSHHSQAGMTLIELTVVLLILIGLAGLLLPYVSGFNQKTHDSTNANNLAALNTNVQRFATEKNALPDNLESLINKAAATAGTATGACATAAIDTIYCGILDPELFTVSTTTFPEAISLGMGGIQTVTENDPDTTNKTFASTTSTTSPTATTKVVGCLDGTCAGKTLASVDCGRDATATPIACADGAWAAGVYTAGTRDTHLAAALGGKPADYNTQCYTYYALGVGDSNELIGRTMSSAPVHFATNGDQGPIQYYNHYVAIVKVDKNNTAPCSTATDAAKFIGAAMGVPVFPDNKLFGQGAGISFAYENQAAN